MSIGTTLALWKVALVTSLQGRAGLVNVSVGYSFPEDNITGQDIWFDEAESDNVIPVMRAGTKKVDEEYVATIIIQVLKNQGESQSVADVRAVELLGELQQALAESPQTVSEIHWAELIGWKNHIGILPSGNGHGSRFTCLVQVRARLYP